MLSILDDQLDINSIITGNFEKKKSEFEVARMFREIISLHSEQAKYQNTNLRLHVDENVPPIIICDAVRLKQILINLVRNALIYTEGSSITLMSKFIKEKS